MSHQVFFLLNDREYIWDLEKNPIFTVTELDDFEIPSHSLFKTDRWDSMLRSGSYYHIPYNVKLFEYNDISENYYLVVRSDFKNYQGEIGKFFDWITPYIKKYGYKTFIGYSLYEEATEPTLYYLKDEL